MHTFHGARAVLPINPGVFITVGRSSYKGSHFTPHAFFKRHIAPKIGKNMIQNPFSESATEPLSRSYSGLKIRYFLPLKPYAKISPKGMCQA